MPLRGEFSRFESVLGYFCKGWFFNSHYYKGYKSFSQENEMVRFEIYFPLPEEGKGSKGS